MKGTIMRRVLMGLWLVVVLLASVLVGAHGVVAANAQEATPPAGEMGPPESFELAPGVTADSMVFVEGQENPSLYRLHFDAGVTYSIAPSTSLELAYVEAGSLTVTLDGATTVGRVGQPEADGEAMAPNTEFVLETGQFIVLQPGVSGEVRNDGDETAIVSVAGLTPSGAQMPEATPAG